MTRTNLAAQCAILCQEPMFRAFLKQHPKVERFADNRAPEPWIYLRDKEHAAIAVRYILDIDSRAELDIDHNAAERWRGLRDDFETWRR